MKNKRKIGFDLDDTTFNFIDNLILFYNDLYSTNLRREQFREYRFSNVCGGTMEEAIRIVDTFYTTKYFERMQPLPGAVEVASLLSQDDCLEAITARPTSIKERTEWQVRTHFKDNFSKIFHTSNHFTGAKNDGTKLEICLREGISVVVEDSLEYAMQFVNTGIKVLLFGNYPWNQNGSLPADITRVENWMGALRELT